MSRPTFLGLLALLLLAAMPTTTLARRGGERDPTRLWREFPLKVEPSATASAESPRGSGGVRVVRVREGLSATTLSALIALAALLGAGLAVTPGPRIGLRRRQRWAHVGRFSYGTGRRRRVRRVRARWRRAGPLERALARAPKLPPASQPHRRFKPSPRVTPSTRVTANSRFVPSRWQSAIRAPGGHHRRRVARWARRGDECKVQLWRGEDKGLFYAEASDGSAVAHSDSFRIDSGEELEQSEAARRALAVFAARLERAGWSVVDRGSELWDLLLRLDAAASAHHGDEREGLPPLDRDRSPDPPGRGG
jgi:hypothetical protein